MPISQKKYINITSTAGAVPAVSQRELIGRVFTSNHLVPANTVIEFGGGRDIALTLVAAYFGSTSAEYAFAERYFGFISKAGTAPKKLGFARYVSEDIPASVIGDTNVSLDALRAITDGSLELNINGAQEEITGINLSSADSLTGVASQVSTAITSGSVVCEYDATNGRFIFKTVATGDGQKLTVVGGTVATALGMVDGIESDGADQKTASQCVMEMEQVSNNFFSFTFLNQLSVGEMSEIAQWTDSQNVRYMYSITTTAAMAESVASAVASYNGVAITLDLHNEQAGFMPMAVIAAVDYTRPNSVVDAMYQQFNGVKVSVADPASQQEYDALRINYYGETQVGGGSVAFYQDGVLQGDVSSIGVFANEAWLKDSFTTNLLNLRLALDSLPASTTGKSLVMNVMSDTIELAKHNGTITSGKTLTAVQKNYISQITGDTDAWLTVQSAGYWINAEIQQYVENDVQKYKIVFTLIYSKGDSINYIEGSDILI